MCHSCTHQERNNFLEANRIITYLQDKMEFCGDFASIFDFCVDFAAIFEPKSWSQANKLDLVFLKLKNRKPLYLLGISDFSWLGALQPTHKKRHCLSAMSPFGVPGRTRTVDIQNHKQSCECLINPVFIGVPAIFDFLFAAILRLFTQGPILFQ